MKARNYKRLIVVLLGLPLALGCLESNNTESQTDGSSRLKIESFDAQANERHDEQDNGRGIKQEWDSRLQSAQNYIENRLNRIARDITFNSVKYDLYLVNWSDITVDVQYVRIADGQQRRIIAKMNANGVRTQMFRESYEADLRTGKKVSEWRGW